MRCYRRSTGWRQTKAVGQAGPTVQAQLLMHLQRTGLYLALKLALRLLLCLPEYASDWLKWLLIWIFGPIHSVLSLAEKGRPTPYPYWKLVLFVSVSSQLRIKVESLDMVICSRAPWEGMRISQPHTVWSLGLSDLFLGREDGGTIMCWGHHDEERCSSFWSKVAVLPCTSEPHKASMSLQPCRLIRITLI